MFAVVKGHEDVVRLWIEYKNIDIDAKDGYGEIALIMANWARNRRNPAIVEILERELSRRRGLGG